jgi:hypothetical protein
MARQRPEQQPLPTWQAFAARHAQMPFLSQDPLYTLRENVIDSVLEYVPTFFTDEQKNFERDLARTSRHGFFLRRPIFGPGGDPFAHSTADTPDGPPAPLAGDVESLLRTPGLTIDQFLEQHDVLPGLAVEGEDRLAPVLRPEWFVPGKLEEAVRALQELLAKLRQARGRPQRMVEKAMLAEEKERELLRWRQEAYAGWLVTNPRYRRELEALREEWEETVVVLGGFPNRGSVVQGRTRAPSRSRAGQCETALQAFYGRWGLEALLTWELPFPLSATVDIVLDPARRLGSGEGITVELPWPLVRGSQLDLRAALRRLRFESAPEHVRDWVCREGDDGPSGETTYHHLFSFYRTLHLVLFRRYPAECKGRIAKLDRAVAEILGRDVELVRKLRQQLARALKDT